MTTRTSQPSKLELYRAHTLHESSNSMQLPSRRGGGGSQLPRGGEWPLPPRLNETLPYAHVQQGVSKMIGCIVVVSTNITISQDVGTHQWASHKHNEIKNLATIGNAYCHIHTHSHTQFRVWICISMACKLHAPSLPLAAHKLLMLASTYYSIISLTLASRSTAPHSSPLTKLKPTNESFSTIQSCHTLKYVQDISMGIKVTIRRP